MSLRIALLIAVWLATALHSFAALAIGKPEWGFDGTVTAGTFNIVSIEIRNTGAAAFDGDITLDDGGAFGSRSAAPYRQKIFLAPGTARWVQFYPYVERAGADWRLVWEEKGREAKEPISPEGGLKAGPPAVVLLADPESPAMRSARMRVFNEANFPPTVAATDALHAVVLDHQPRWDPARREAFLDWLKRGGTVHLLAGADGAMPVFTDELAPLNKPGNVGAGRVIAHKLNRADVTEKALADAGFPAPEYKANTNADQYGYGDESDDGYFNTLASVTKPNIAWWLIYLLTVVYVVLIGPVFYILRKRDYRALLAGFLATVALFAWIFTVVGRRGYGEKQIYHSLAIARGIEGGKWDVRHYVHAFATSGDIYNLTYPGASQLFAAPSRGGETVRASVIHGKDAHIEADIPLFSARPFVHRGVMMGPDLGLKVTAFTQKIPAAPITATITASGDKLQNVTRAGVQYGDKFYRLKPTATGWQTDLNPSGSLSNAIGDGSDNDHYYSGYYYRQSPEQAVGRLRESLSAPLAREISDDEKTRRTLTSRAVPAGHIRVFIYALAPEAFRMNTERFNPGLEYVLYVLDLPVGNL